jgi:hypothetical protein
MEGCITPIYSMQPPLLTMRPLREYPNHPNLNQIMSGAPEYNRFALGEAL